MRVQAALVLRADTICSSCSDGDPDGPSRYHCRGYHQLSRPRSVVRPSRGFERIDALGFREMTLHLSETAIAHGFAAVIPDRLEVTVGNGRGERT